VRAVLDRTPASEGARADLEARLRAFYEAVAEATGLDGSSSRAAELADLVADVIETVLEPVPPVERIDAAAMVSWVWLSPIGDLAPGDPVATTRAWFDELRLAAPLTQGLRHAGLDEAEAWTAADLVRTLLHLARPSQIKGAASERDRRLLERWLADEIIRPSIGVNTWQGVEYISRDRFARMLEWTARLERFAGVDRDRTLVERLLATAEAAGYRVDRLLASLGEPAAAGRPGVAAKPAKASKPKPKPKTKPGGPAR
jgi:hypothetical protein